MLEEGSVVVSLAGKDKNALLAVVTIAPDGLLVADGRHRPVQRPKRKNPRHVADTGRRLTRERMATNRELRRALREEEGVIAGSQPAAIT
jgi:ribosomal protein L14E/L6E/L27E